MSAMSHSTWHRVDEIPDEGRVRTAVVDGRTVALTRCGGRVGALDNHCPHQGGPLGEGSIENGCCAVRGTVTTTTRSLAGHRRASPTRRWPSRSRSVTDGRTSSCPSVPDRPRSVSDVLVETLVAWGVDTVFGMVGHSNLGFAEALRRAEARGELRYIGIRHEGAAAFAASAYGKLTGRPAACFAIAGPGSTNLLTGLYDAKLDGAPVVAISGQVPSKVLGRGAFQDLDLSAVFRDVAVSTVTIHAGSDHAELAATAVKHALDGRGVAHLVLPDEVQDLPSAQPAALPEGRRADLRIAPPTLDAALRQAPRRPAAGAHRRPGRARGDRRRCATRRTPGCAGAHHVPGQGPGARHPSARRGRARPVGHPGGVVADERVRPAVRRRRVVLQSHRDRGLQADRSGRRRALAIGRFDPVRVGVLGDAASRCGAADALGDDGRASTSGRTSPPAGRSGGPRKPAAPPTTTAGAWRRSVFAALDHTLSRRRGHQCRRRQPRLLVRSLLRERRPAGADVGIPRVDRVRISRCDGRMGRRPRRPIMAVTGDGGFGQYLAELTTAVKYGIPIKHVLLDNGSLGKISKEQLAGQPGMADLPGQPRLRRLRTPLRRDRHHRRTAPTSTTRCASSSPPTAQRCCTCTPTPSWSGVSTSLVIVFAIAAVAPLIAVRLRLPGALLEIVAGIVLGPSLLGLVHSGRDLGRFRVAGPVVPAVPGGVGGRPSRFRGTLASGSPRRWRSHWSPRPAWSPCSQASGSAGPS